MVHHVGENTFSYLQSVMGKKITYHEGPKEQTGKLLAINPEYMVLSGDDGAVEYWNLQHIKRVKFHSKIHQRAVETQETELAAPVYHADSFPSLMRKLKNSYVTVDRGKKHSKAGWVVDANPDFFVLLTKEMGPIYYPYHHIRNIVHHVRNIVLAQNEEKEENVVEVQPVWETAPLAVKTAKTLEGLMEELKYTWVRINEGPDKLEGMVTECTGGHVTLVSNENVYRLPCHHIRQISLGFTPVDDTDQTTDANSTPSLTLSRYTLLIKDSVSHTPRPR